MPGIRERIKSVASSSSHIVVRLQQALLERHKLGFPGMEEEQAKLAPKEIREGLLEEVTLELSLEGDLSFRRQRMGEGYPRRGDSRAKAGKYEVCSGLVTTGGLMGL